MITQQDKITVSGVSFFYGTHQVLHDIDATFKSHSITAIMGPSGQGKSTLLGLFNRLWDDIPNARVTGQIRIHLGRQWVDPVAPDIPRPMLRRQVAMIFQEPNPLPMSIAGNMAFPLKLAGRHNSAVIAEKVEAALRQAYLWDEVKNRMTDSALSLSGGQKQRLCIARALVLEPQVLLCDEPTSSLDKKAARIIEQLLVSLKQRCTLLMVSHSRTQVQRIADRVMAMRSGKLVG